MAHDARNRSLDLVPQQQQQYDDHGLAFGGRWSDMESCDVADSWPGWLDGCVDLQQLAWADRRRSDVELHLPAVHGRGAADEGVHIRLQQCLRCAVRRWWSKLDRCKGLSPGTIPTSEQLRAGARRARDNREGLGGLD